MNHNKMEQTVAPGFFKLGVCLIYEALTVVALSFVFAGVFLWFAGDATQGLKRVLLQLFLWFGIGVYLIRCWVKTGQTLAMQAWRLKLVNQDAALLSFSHAVIRYIMATISLLLFGLGFLWALFDKDRLFLHDRLLKCKIIIVPK